jgi:hypothetical protein
MVCVCLLPSPIVRLILLVPLALAACTRVTALEGPPQDLHTVYTDALAAPRQPPILQPKPLAVGPEVPYTPVMQPPQIQRVWVPDQLNSTGDLVSGHWVYLLLEKSQWSLETVPPTPPPTLQVPLAPPAGLPTPATASRPAAVSPTGSRATPARRARGSRRQAPTPASAAAGSSPAPATSGASPPPPAAASAPPPVSPSPEPRP